MKAPLLPATPSLADYQGPRTNDLSSSQAKPGIDQTRIVERYANDQVPVIYHDRATNPGKDADVPKPIADIVAEREDMGDHIPVEQFAIPTTPSLTHSGNRPHHLTSSQSLSDLPIPSLSSTALVGFIVILAYFSPLLAAAAGAFCLWADRERREAERKRDPEEDREKVKGKVAPHVAMREESTEWL